MVIRAILRSLRILSILLAGASPSEASVDGPPSQHASEATPKKVTIRSELDTSVYVRSDSDHTTVVSPRVHFRGSFEHRRGTTNLDLVHVTDVWTSASIDIRTAASPRVTEQRDEIVAAVEHGKETWTLGVGYRLSNEPDFVAHGVTFVGAWEGFSRNVRLDARVVLERDRVGRSGDPVLERRLHAIRSWFGYTQVLSRSTLMQLAVEQGSTFGFQSSPYRWVGLGGASDCSTAQLCVPEVHPDRRARFAFVGRLRQGMGKRVSTGLDYRYYIDSWAIQSHTAGLDLRVRPSESLLLALEYRAYFQSGAWFYRSHYDLAPPGGFASRDRELSSMFDHRGSLALDWSTRLARVTLGSGLLLGVALHGYDDFLGLDRVVAGEGSWVGRVEF